jgi:hypothetical protein
MIVVSIGGEIEREYEPIGRWSVPYRQISRRQFNASEAGRV